MMRCEKMLFSHDGCCASTIVLEDVLSEMTGVSLPMTRKGWAPEILV
jgi:hypothetical protein